MLIHIEDIPVFFPYDFIYPEQYSYMCELKKTLDAKGHCLLEMPSGTGKTITILAFFVAYQQVRKTNTRLIYCSRTVPEIEKALSELQRLIKYWETSTQKPLDFLGLGLASRRHLCINETVNKERNGKVLDARCQSLTASWIRDQREDQKEQSTGGHIPFCASYENLEDLELLSIPSGVYRLEDLKKYGQDNKLCPYFLTRRLLPKANIIIYSYHYLLDPKVAEMVSKELSKDSVVVFDEAHNIDNVCIESLSIDLTRSTLDSATKGLKTLSNKISNLKEHDASKLKEEYDKLVQGLNASRKDNDEVSVNPVLSQEILEEAVPGNIRKAEHFVSFLKRFSEFLKIRLKALDVMSETPLQFLKGLKEQTFIDKKGLVFASERLASLIRTLEITELEDFTSLSQVAAFGTTVASYSEGFAVIMEPFDSMAKGVPNPILHLCCLDASIAISSVFERFQSVIITSGTLSPLEMYPNMLRFSTVTMKSFTMSLVRDCFRPLIITRGSDQIGISSKFDVRNDPAVIRNYGNVLLEYAKIVPDGLVCFFPSYIYMEGIIAQWNEIGVIQSVLKHKLVFVETPDSVETQIALTNYRKACDNGRGAVLLSVARGKVSEGIDFDLHYGRAVIMFGIPYQYTESRILKARLEYLREHYGILEKDFLTFDAIRHAAQCIGRVIRGKSDYGLMVLADKRFCRRDKRDKLPKWIDLAVRDERANLSTDMAVHVSKRFFREMGQPFNQMDQIGVALWDVEDIQRHKIKQGL